MITNLALARSIVGSFIVNVKHHPEYLVTDPLTQVQTCERNYKVAIAMQAIDSLIKSL